MQHHLLTLNWYPLIRTLLLMALLPLSVHSGPYAGTGRSHEVIAEDLPELDEIYELLDAGRPAGVVFLVMDHDEEAYLWVLPRVERYAQMLRDKWPDIPLTLLSHGDEIFSLLSRNESEYASFHTRIGELGTNDNIKVQVCGAYASLSGMDESEFADIVEVVPSVTARITDYRQIGYQIISLEPPW